MAALVSDIEGSCSREEGPRVPVSGARRFSLIKVDAWIVAIFFCFGSTLDSAEEVSQVHCGTGT